jgi:hypothetical protein
MIKTIRILVLGCLFLLPGSEIAQANQNAVAHNPSPCQVRVDNVHISDAMLKSTGQGYLKANADAICNIRLDQAVVTVEIWKKGNPFNHKVASYDQISPRAVPIGKVFSNKSTTKKCLSGEVSFYYAHARVIGISNGITVSSPWVPSARPELICCGT